MENNVPHPRQHVHILLSGTCDCSFKLQKGLFRCDYKSLERDFPGGSVVEESAFQRKGH